MNHKLLPDVKKALSTYEYGIKSISGTNVESSISAIIHEEGLS